MIQGYKTYLVALAMAVVGCLFLFASGVATYADPAGDYSAAVKRIVAVVLISQGLAVAALRHAITTAVRTITRYGLRSN